MTHKDIYTKFMIEYDKAGASTSYPSLTEYEVATFLDKAYNALIAQKVTGNNVRGATFESDIKSIADLGPLVNTLMLPGIQDNSIAPNIYRYNIADEYIESVSNSTSDTVLRIFIPSTAQVRDGGEFTSDSVDSQSYHLVWVDGKKTFAYMIMGANHGTAYYKSVSNAEKQAVLNTLNGYVHSKTPFYIAYNQTPGRGLIFTGSSSIVYKPIAANIENNGKTESFWLRKNFLYFLQGSMLYDGPKDINGKYYSAISNLGEVDYKPVDGVVTGRGIPVKLVNHEIAQKFFTTASNIPWIKEPVCFIEGSDVFVVYDLLNPPADTLRVTFIKQPNTFVKDLSQFTSGTWTYFTPDKNATDVQNNLYQFECNSTVAEELVSLAVSFALENVESQRLNSKLNMRGLEA